MPVTAIIPAYNEARTIGSVVSVCLRSPQIEETIVVSDGSSDDTAMIAERAGARVIVREKNQGKGEAMRLGARTAKTEIIVFLDADLIGLNENHLQKLIAPVVENEVMMQIGYVDRGCWSIFSKVFLLSGQRAMKRELFFQLTEAESAGFSVETALNALCQRKKLSVGNNLLRGLSHRNKVSKLGLWRALREYLKMWLDVSVSFMRMRLINRKKYGI